MELRLGQEISSKEALLEAAGLHIHYRRAEGDYLYPDEDTLGWEGPVLDLVGGFGSTLLGHNHPELVRVLQDALSSGCAVQVQASERYWSNQLKQFLATKLKQLTGHSYQIQLLSTGTEAVEAAIKHALYAFERRKQDAQARVLQDVRRWQHLVSTGQVCPDRSWYRAAEQLLGFEPIHNQEQFIAALHARNQACWRLQPHLAAFEGAFHGKTLGALQCTWNRDARLPFYANHNRVWFIDPSADFLSKLQMHYADFICLEPQTLQWIRQPMNPLAAFIYEPIQGEGGIVELSDEAIALLQAVEHSCPDTALIADEIQCGLGRSGYFLHCQHRAMPHHYLTLAKSLGGGLCKISAVAVREDLSYPEFNMIHSSTFAEDSLSSLVAIRTLQLIEKDQLAQRCQQMGRFFKRQLQAVQQRWPEVLCAVRGQGLMLGIELADFSQHASMVLRGLHDERMLSLVVAGYLLHQHQIRIMPSLGQRQVIRLQPSAYFSEADVEKVVTALEQTCQLLEQGQSALLLQHLIPGCQLAGRTSLVEPMAHSVSLRPKTDKPIYRVGFISHLIEPQSLPDMDASLQLLSTDELELLNERIQPVQQPALIASQYVRSTNGNWVELLVYGIQMDANAIEHDRHYNQSAVFLPQVHKAFQQAREDGCQLVGFGGYTSIVTGNCSQFVQERPAVTSGNSLTVASSLAAIEKAADEMALDLAKSTIAVCGAAGNIGMVHATFLGLSCGHLRLIGRQGQSGYLQSCVTAMVAEWMTELERSPAASGVVQMLATFIADAKVGGLPVSAQELASALLESGVVSISEDAGACLEADIIVCCSNSPVPVLRAEHIAADKAVLISDIAVPADVDPAVCQQRPLMRLLRGGLVYLPENTGFSLPGMCLEPGYVYACAAETILLGLSGVQAHFSVGTVTCQQVREIRALAAMHGFVLDRDKQQYVNSAIV